MPPLQRLLEIMRRLRDPQHGCPWDREQTFASIAPYTIEEAYEVADAIERQALDELRGELGDLLFQVVFYAQMAEEAGLFGFDDVAEAIADKLERRHPHVFGDASVDDAEAQTRNWEAIKAAERQQAAGEAPLSALDGVGLGQPALSRAVKLQKRASRVGFDWNAAEPVLAKIAEELEEVRVEMVTGAGQERLQDEVGDLLFAVSNLARHLGLDPETALRGANAKFERRFRRVETLVREQGRSLQEAGLEGMEEAWQQAKREERAGEA